MRGSVVERPRHALGHGAPAARLRWLVRSLLILVLVSGCSGSERPAVHVVVAATCADVTGAGEVRRAGRPYWEPLRRGTALRDGDWVRTRAGTTAHLELMAGGRLDLSESAVVVIEPPELPGAAVAAKGPSIGIEEGEVRATLAAADLPLKIRRGTGETQVLESPAVYRLSAGTDAGIEVQRLDAPPTEAAAVVDVRAPRPSGAAPATFPSSLTPGIDARLKFDPRGWVRLTWSPVAGAQRYRVQTARDWSFNVETRNADVEGTSWLMRPEGVGLYVWRVAAIGPGGQLGEFGYARRLFLEEHTPTDLLVSPGDGFTSAEPAVTFSWQAPGSGSSYRVMVSKGVDPQRAPVFNQVTAAAQTTAPALQPGTYTWGVYEEGAVLRPLFLKPRKLVVKASPRK